MTGGGPVIEARDDVRVVVAPGRHRPDPALRAAGEPHVERVRGHAPTLRDGDVLAMVAVDGGTIHARAASYVDMVATADALAADPALHARARALAGPDPLRTGRGRVAALGVSVVTTVGDRVLLGRRSDALALDPGRWHVVPSGMLEPGDADPLAAAVARETAEELGLGPRAVPAAGTLRPLGLGWDVERLRIEACLWLALREDVAVRADGEELVAIEALTSPPADLTAAGRAALALYAQVAGRPEWAVT